MKKLFITLGMIGVLVLTSASMSYSQSFINKLKKKAENKLIEKAFDEKEDPQNQDQQSLEGSDDASPSSIRNTRGSGLVSTPPDVNANIADAEKSFGEKEYSKTRHSIRQALLGIELEIGQNILHSLPDNVKALEKNEEFDKVTSTGIGFVGLVVERVYQGVDQEFRVTIGNDGLLPASVNMYQGTAVYESSEEQNHKQVDYKGYKSVLEYDDYEGYTLSVPFGQSSVMVMNGVNFADEQEMMQTAEQIDIEKVKNQLGEK